MLGPDNIRPDAPTLPETTLDDAAWSFGDMPASADLQWLVDAARARLAGTGRLLIRVRVNGADATPESLEEQLPAPIGSFERLELISDQPKAIVLDVLREAQRQFSNSFEHIKDASDAFSAGDPAAAMTQLAHSVEIWAKTQEAVVKSVSLLKLDLDAVVVEDRPLAEWLQEVVKQLSDVSSAIKDRDHVLLADILRYEFDESLQAWERLLAGIMEHVTDLPDDVGTDIAPPRAASAP